MSFSISLSTTLLGLSTPLPGIITTFEFIPPKMQGRNMLGAPLYTGWEGRVLVWSIMDVQEWADLWIATGGDDFSSIVDGYIRCPDWGQNTGTELWGDYECVIDRPIEGRWDRGVYRYDVRVTVTRMERVRDSV